MLPCSGCWLLHLVGRVTVKVLPLSSSDATDMVPPSRRTSARTWARPMPWPGRPGRRRGGTGRRSADDPSGRCRGHCRSLRRSQSRLGAAADVRMSPGTPGLRYFSALSIRLEKICSSASRSLTTLRQRLDANRALRPPRPDGRRWWRCLRSARCMSTRSGWNSRRPSRVRLRIAAIRRSILRDRRFDEAERFGEILRKLLVGVVENRFGAVGRILGRLRLRRCSAAEGCDALEDVAAQLLELAGEAHDVDQRRAQVVADDIGEALDLLVGLAQVGGALVDGGLEVEVLVAQSRFGLVARRARSAGPGRSTCRPARSPRLSRRW